MNILFVQCSNSGIAYWRLYNPWVAIHRNLLANARVLWWQKDLKEVHPWQTDINPTKDAILANRVTMELQAYVETADVIVFQMIHTFEALQTIHAIRMGQEAGRYPKAPILCEIDDDIINTPESNPAAIAYRPGSYFSQLAIEQFRNSDGLIVSTPYLKELYSEFNDHIYVVPNSIDFELWGKTKNKPRPGVRVGWIAGASHDEDLGIIEPVIRNITTANPLVKFVMCHGVPQFIKDIPGVEFVPKWARIDKYPQHIASQDFDIGIAPLFDRSFNRAKSNLRWLEYAALRIPCVASNVGHFKETIKHGQDGFLADTPEQFEHYIQLLIDDSRIRKEVGRNAYMRAQSDFNIDKTAKAYVESLKEVISRGVVKKAPTLEVGIETELDIKPLQELKE